MPYPPSLAAGLNAGLQGFMRGRDQRAERDAQEQAVAYRHQQDAAQTQRQSMLDERQRAQMEAQAQAMQETRTRQAAQDEIAQQGRLKSAAEDGYVATDRVQQDLDGLMGDIAPKVKAPAFSIGQTGMVKVRPSEEQADKARQFAQRSAELSQNNQWQTARDEKQDTHEIDRDKRNRASMENIARIGATAKATQGDARTDARSDALANKLRSQYEAHPAVKQGNLIAGMLQNVTATAQNPNAAGDLSMIFSYMKILDPNSVVRETEFANAQNAAGVPDRIRNAYNKAMTGQRLTPEQRKEFVGQARSIAANARGLLKQQNDRYSQISAQMGVDPSLVVFDPYETLDQEKPRPFVGPRKPVTHLPGNPYAGRPDE